MNVPTFQQFIDKSATLTFSEHVHVATAEYFKGLERSTLPLTGNPLPNEKSFIESLFPCPVKWQAPKTPVLRPHEPLAIIRDGMRTVFHDMKKKLKALKSLQIGAAQREIGNELTNENMYFSLHNSEAKDEDRIFTPMLNRVSALVQTAQRTTDLLDDVELNLMATAEEVVEVYGEAMGLRDRIGFNLERSGRQFARLIYEDSHYNKDWEDFYEDFRSTGAATALIIGLLPVELIEKECPESELYRIGLSKDGWARMTDLRGHANGYMHDLKKWRALLEKPAYQGKEFSLVSEIVCRVGPFVIINMSRTMKAGVITRDITLFREPYMKVVDLRLFNGMPRNVADLVLQAKVDMKRIFLIKREEYFQVYDYVASLADTSINLTTVTAMIRKRSGGAALIDKVFTKKWALDDADYVALAAVVILRVAYDRSLLTSAADGLFTDGLFKSLWRSALTAIRLPRWFATLVYKEDLVPKLVTAHDPILAQTVRLAEVKAETERRFLIFGPKKKEEEMLAGQTKKCEFCALLPWLHKRDHRDEQEMVCGNDFVTQKFGMSDAEVDAFRNSLLPEDTDPEALARVKQAARAKCPSRGFSTETKYVFLEGAFGTGKSYQVKKLVQEGDVVIAPFKKLLDDYKEDKDGNPIFFKTLHRAMADHRSCRRMFVDECSSVPYEFLSVLVYLYQPDEVILVGDFKQSKTTGAEGTCLDRRLNVQGSHYLKKNFRNNEAVIEWAVEKYGYDLEKAKSTQPGALFEYCEDVPDGISNISPDRALVDVEETEATVRSWQGQTTQDLCITLTPESLRTWSVPCIKLVGLTRAKGTTFIRLTEGVDRETFESIVFKREYARVSAKARSRSKEAQVGRLVLCLQKKFADQMAVRHLVRAFPEEVLEAHEAEQDRELALVDFLARPETLEDLVAEAEGDESDEEDETDAETDAGEEAELAEEAADDDDDDDDDPDPIETEVEATAEVLEAPVAENDVEEQEEDEVADEAEGEAAREATAEVQEAPVATLEGLVGPVVAGAAVAAAPVVMAGGFVAAAVVTAAQVKSAATIATASLTSLWAVDTVARTTGGWSAHYEACLAKRRSWFKELTVAETIDAYDEARALAEAEQGRQTAEAVDAEFWAVDGPEQRRESAREAQLGRTPTMSVREWRARTGFHLSA
uniref:Replicase n=1 Tax=Agaricus bisporus virus 13 TaxID=1945743 RepID=A0A1Q1N6J4_9VIRU|nr:replicase [Agaricus bisporus virus 13]